MIAAVVMEMTLDLVMATSFSWGSVLVDSSAVVSCSDVVRRFSFLKLFDFSNRLLRLESELFLVRWDAIASLDDCRFNELPLDAVDESVGFRFEVLSAFSVDFSLFRLVDGNRLRLEGSRFKLVAAVFFVDAGVFLRLGVASFFGSVGVFLGAVVDLIAIVLLLFTFFRIDDLSWSFSRVGFVVGFPDDLVGTAGNLFLDVRVLVLRVKLVLLPDRDRL